jgi:hypothetical protein
MRSFLWNALAVTGLFTGIGAVGIVLASISVIVVAVTVPLAFLLAGIVIMVFVMRGAMAMRRWKQVPARL